MSVRIEDLKVEYHQDDRPLELLPDPEPRDVFCWTISVDDHLLEPTNLFEGRMPARLAEHAPQPVEINGYPVWRVEGRDYPVVGFNGCSGRPMDQWHRLAIRYDEMRRGVWDSKARLADMDVAGVWASLCFPSIVWGFAGRTLSAMKDPEVALASVRAYNSWMLEEWCGAAPDRFIPCQLAYLSDPIVAAAEIRANAERGFRAVTFTENPETLGLPTIYSEEWDPFFAACVETGTSLNIHIGSSGSIIQPSKHSPTAVLAALFPLNGMATVVDWIFAKIPVRFPDLRIVMSEAGVSWVPMIIERLRRAHRMQDSFAEWSAADGDPVDCLHRNFYFTSIEDPTAFQLLDQIGEERVMIEVDYPHSDSSWPDNQELLRSQLGHLDPSTIRRVCFENAAELYQHPAPPEHLVAQSGFGAATRAVR